MTDVPKKLVVDLDKGTHEYIELTAEEIQQRELDAIEFATRKAEEDAAKAAHDALKASAKEKLIAGQPLTAEEAETLIV
jgi:predicted methyltransferase